MKSRLAQAVVDHEITPGVLTLDTDNGIAYTSCLFRARLADHGVTHRRGGYRDPESHALIESWFSKLKLRCVWREEFETLQQTRQVIGDYRDRPHSGLNYNTQAEVAKNWQSPENLQNNAA